jgi:predicted Zn-dependent protease
MAPAAIEQFQQAIELQPELAVAHYHLAKLYLRVGDKAHANEELALYESLRKQEGATQKARPIPLPDFP